MASSVSGQGELNHTLLLATRVSKMYGLLCEVKMAGYWPSSFSACLWTEKESSSINSQKNERGQYPVILTEQAWSIKDLLYGYSLFIIVFHSCVFTIDLGLAPNLIPVPFLKSCPGDQSSVYNKLVPFT